MPGTDPTNTSGLDFQARAVGLCYCGGVARGQAPAGTSGACNDKADFPQQIGWLYFYVR